MSQRPLGFGIRENETGKKVFSFCIYGESRTYLEGLLSNLSTITSRYASFEKHVYAGSDISEAYIAACESFHSTYVHRLPFTGGRLMSHRFLAIDLPNVELMIVRDADSRITDRDRWCIDDFIASDFDLFTIRDHKYHYREIMGGLWGMRRIAGFSMCDAYEKYTAISKGIDRYQSDQDFLRNFVYRRFRQSLLAYSPTWAFLGENFRKITLARNGHHDFCGNVIIIDAHGERPQFESNDGLPDNFLQLERLHKYSKDGSRLTPIEWLRAILSGD
jgi:hypothetical protein